MIQREYPGEQRGGARSVTMISSRTRTEGSEIISSARERMSDESYSARELQRHSFELCVKTEFASPVAGK